MLRWFQSLRARLIIFVVIAALPALLLTLYNGLEQRQTAAREAQQEALRLVRFAAVNHALMIENTRGFLYALAHSIAPEAGNLEYCQRIFPHLLQEHFPYFVAFYVADLKGNVVCSMPSGDVPKGLFECEHFQDVLKLKDYAVSRYHICNNTGLAVISMGYPVWDLNRNMSGVINVSLNLAMFNEMVSSANLLPGSTFTVLDRDGTILAHYPEPNDLIGQLWPAGSLLERLMGPTEGTTEGIGLDGINRLYAYLPLEGSESSIHLALGLPAELAYAAADRNLVRNLLLLSGAIVLALIAAWFLGEVFILRQTHALVQATRRVAGGELGTRTGLPYQAGELGQLAESFDQMAASLEQRETERDHAEAAMRAYAADLERSNRDLQDFANIASHDMQEPLRKIRTFADLLQMRSAANLDAQGKDYLARMYSAASRLQYLTQDLLTYSRLSSRADLSQEVDMREIAHQVLSDLELEVEQSGAQIELENLPIIQADPTQMRHLLHNLISNALKFRHPERVPHVVVRAEIIRSNPENGHKNGKTCQITVQDNGIGFNEKYRDRIFQPFQRLHNREAYPGTGMGLAICRKVVERHGGTITAQSTQGNGTCFIINLPCQQLEERSDEQTHKFNHLTG